MKKKLLKYIKNFNSKRLFLDFMKTLSVYLVATCVALALNEASVMNDNIFGVYMLATGGDPTHMALSPQGLFWGLAAAVAVMLYTLLPRPLLARHGRIAVTGLGMLAGGIFLNLAARSWNFSVSLPLRGWLAVTAIVVLGSAVAFALLMQGISDIGPVRSSMLAATEPVSATVFSALWLGTAFSATDLIGFGAILITIILLAKRN